jgi:predicted O-methyltransferase YrrM
LALACSEGAQILEIGSHLGASTCYLTAGAAHRRGTVTCIDTWQNDAMPDGTQDTYEQFLKNVEPVRERLRLIRRPVQEVTPHDLSESFDLIFLDADHAYDATMRDFQLAERVIKPNGIIAFHDSAEFEGVARAIGTILAGGQWVVAGAVQNLLWIKRAKWLTPPA